MNPIIDYFEKPDNDDLLQVAWDWMLERNDPALIQTAIKSDQFIHNLLCSYKYDFGFEFMSVWEEDVGVYTETVLPGPPVLHVEFHDLDNESSFEVVIKENNSTVKLISVELRRPFYVVIDWNPGNEMISDFNIQLTDEQQTTCERIISILTRFYYCETMLRNLAQKAFDEPKPNH